MWFRIERVTEYDWESDIELLLTKLERIVRIWKRRPYPPLVTMEPFALAVQPYGRWRPKAKVFRKGGVPTVLLMAFAGFHLCVSIPLWARRWL